MTAQTPTSQAPSPKAPSRIPVALCLAVVLICLGLGGAFVWWYLAGPGDSRLVKLSPSDLASLEAAGQRLNYQGVPIGAPPRGLGTAPDVDGVFPSGFTRVIRAGPVEVMVRVNFFAPNGLGVLVFRQRHWGMLHETVNFTIARRAVHENPVAQQLALTDEQLTQLKAIVEQPALSGAYITTLPIPDADRGRANAVWAQYLQAVNAGKMDAAKAIEPQLLRTVRQVGSAAMSRAREQYTKADQAIGAVLTERQIQAYLSGKSLK